MRYYFLNNVIATTALFLLVFFASAQDGRTQYPSFLINSYYGVDIGYINYPFSQKQLEPGLQAASVKVPHTAVRIILFGYRFNKYLSAQVTYMRPVDWVDYKNINGDQLSHRVAMNIAGLTLRSSIPLSKKIFIDGEAGLGIITCGGFIVNNTVGLKDASYAGLLLAGGLSYRLNSKWKLGVNAMVSPGNKNKVQPASFFLGTGFTYTMSPLPEEKLPKQASGYSFPRQLIQLSVTSNGAGYGVNDFVSKGAIPVFWGGEVQVAKGISFNYQRNVFHTRKVFSLDWAVGMAFWQSRKNKETFFTASVYPVFRFSFLRLRPVDFYFNYSVAGPSFISRPLIDNRNTGKRFTFRDAMGIGAYLGKKRTLNAEINIAHYSNGNLFPQNDGIMIPLTFSAGYTFN